MDDLPTTSPTWYSARRRLYKLHEGDSKSFYCGCDLDLQHRRLNPTACGLGDIASDPRSKQVQAEHIVPAATLGQGQRCWTRPTEFEDCKKPDGKYMSGRECCKVIDPTYRTAYTDLHNLQPAVGSINYARSNYTFGEIPGEERSFGNCNFEVDAATRTAEPPGERKGDIARTAFYMRETYGIPLPGGKEELYRQWDREDPPNAFEQARSREIAQIQGRGNRFIDDYQPAPRDAQRTSPPMDLSANIPEMDLSANIPEMDLSANIPEMDLSANIPEMDLSVYIPDFTTP